MATKTWIGGGNNRANNPQDWSPQGVPAAGDTAIITHGTMDIDGFNLASRVEVQGTAEINLSHDARVRSIEVTAGHPTIDVKNQANFELDTDGGSTVVNLQENSHWIGKFVASTNVVINGANHASFIGSQTSLAIPLPGLPAPHITINANIGNSPTRIQATQGATVEVAGSVGREPLFEVNSFPSVASDLRLDHPNTFSGAVMLGVGRIDLIGLAQADSYSYKNDLLSIYSSGTLIDTLLLYREGSWHNEVSRPVSIGVTRTSEGVSIYTTNGPSPGGSPLHLHD